MKKFNALGYSEHGHKLFYAEAPDAQTAWEKMWIEANNRGYSLPFENVTEIS